ANGVTATRGKGPWIHRACITFESEIVARQAERFLKRQKRRDILESVIRASFGWPKELLPLGCP
ncbi:MAG: hypothetical protein O3A51_01135, partial [Verrucomicrobia bacterium]|nr:hypothetical protein [Verrucomicrobiota bacterium]